MAQNKRNTRPTAQLSLTPQLLGLLRESWWLLLVAAAIYLVLILLSFDPHDPGWSHSVRSGPIHNPGGTLGAWLSDLLLSVFGISAWWWVVFCLTAISWGYRKLDLNTLHPLPTRWLAVIGFILVLACSSALETLRLYQWHLTLPDQAGGMLGRVLADYSLRSLGFTGATLVLMAIAGIGFSLFTGWSWLHITEGIGARVEGLYGIVWRNWQTRLDRKAGELAAAERDAIVVEEKRKQQDKAPVQVIVPGEKVEPLYRTHRQSPTVETPAEPAMADTWDSEETDDDTALTTHPTTEDFFETSAIPPWEDRPVADTPPPVPVVIPSVKIEQSARVLKEKQVSLFADNPESAIPPLSLLAPIPEFSETVAASTLEYTSRLIERKLADFGVQVQVVAAYPGPVITRYEIEPATGVKGSQIVNLMRDLARALSLISIRVVETIPGKAYMALELPNPKRQIVRLTEILSSSIYNNASSPLTLAMGKDISGQPVVADLAKMPHLLVAGTTGAGKSVAINAMILSLLYKAPAEQVRLILIDPKMLEMSIYEGIPHLLAPVVTDMKQAANALNWCVFEMEKRYKLMSHMGVRNLAGYNQKIAEALKRGDKLTNPFSLTPDTPEPLEHLPFIVVVIDELADLMMVAGKKIEELIARLAQKARAAGIHLILATQRPSVDVITGLIKANIPTRVAFQVSSKIDSRTILDQMGAEALLGQGDMLYLPPGTGYPQRVHGAFVADDEVHAVVDYLKQFGEPNYIEGILSGAADDGSGPGGNLEGSLLEGAGEADALYDDAVAFVLKSRRASISAVQRQLRIGYNRAARLIEQMEGAGLVSTMETNGNRTVLVPARDE